MGRNKRKPKLKPRALPERDFATIDAFAEAVRWANLGRVHVVGDGLLCVGVPVRPLLRCPDLDGQRLQLVDPSGTPDDWAECLPALHSRTGQPPLLRFLGFHPPDAVLKAISATGIRPTVALGMPPRKSALTLLRTTSWGTVHLPHSPSLAARLEQAPLTGCDHVMLDAEPWDLKRALKENPPAPPPEGIPLACDAHGVIGDWLRVAGGAIEAALEREGTPMTDPIRTALDALKGHGRHHPLDASGISPVRVLLREGSGRRCTPALRRLLDAVETLANDAQFHDWGRYDGRFTSLSEAELAWERIRRSACPDPYETGRGFSSAILELAPAAERESIAGKLQAAKRKGR